MNAILANQKNAALIQKKNTKLIRKMFANMLPIMHLIHFH